MSCKRTASRAARPSEARDRSQRPGAARPSEARDRAQRDERPRRCLALRVATALGVSVLVPSSLAWAQPLRLRADALAETQSPTGLVVLQGQDTARPWVDAEALVWAGSKPGLTGDVLVLTMRVREPHGYGELRAGRFVLATGAVHPVQLDGAEAIGRAPWGSTIETFGGLPVVPRFGSRSYDWLAGGRVAQSIASQLTLGVSYVQRREGGEIYNEELGADLAAAPVRWLDLAARGSYDVTSPGLAEALASLAARVSDWRLELFASQRSPGRLLPATSLFSVLGDFPSQMVGGTIRWKAAGVQAAMRAAVVVAHVFAQDALSVPFAEDQNVVEAVATERPHETLAYRVRQRRSGWRAKAAHPKAAEPPAEARVVDAVAVVQQIAWRRVADGLDHALRDPRARRVRSDTYVDDPTARSRDMRTNA
jgi:hypothetical protein